jgi:hypothetical protein
MINFYNYHTGTLELSELYKDGLDSIHTVATMRHPSLMNVLHIIKKDSYMAFQYTHFFIRERWLEAEPYIMKDPGSAYYYAKYIIEGRWVEAEPYIKPYASWSYNYATEVLKSRFLEAEDCIRSHYDTGYWVSYCRIFGL